MSEIYEPSKNPDLDETTAGPDPLLLFRRWFDDAIASGSRLPDAMTLATATKDGAPSARMVLLKQADENGLVFFTNYNSRKAQELDSNPRAALVLYWVQLDRQIRVEGSVERISSDESDEYFSTRPRESQIGALASPQSEVIASREVLTQRFKDYEEMFRDRHVPRPAHWGGYRLTPVRIEFWQNREGRLHDRILFERGADAAWSIKRLAP
jgi:pyridoxamine 5'-phosphate oxidase